MKICVCSDSHGNSDGISEMLRVERPDGLIFLGDGWGDVGRADVSPGSFFHAVAGNCDIGCPEQDDLVVELLNKRIFVTHGHRHRVKFGLSNLVKQASQRGAQVALFGHTHKPASRETGGLLLLNPGAMQDGRYLTLCDQGGELVFEHKSLDG